MGTTRITSTQSSPATTFTLEADLLAGSQSTSTNTSKVRCYIKAVNGPGGSTGSSYGGSGSQTGYVNGSAFRTHSGTPFLPSGVANGGTRWYEGPYDVTVTHNAQGYATVTLAMNLTYGSVSTTPSTTLTLPRIAKAPTAPGTPTVSAITSGGATISWTAPSDNGGSAITSYTVQWATAADFSTGVGSVVSSGTGTSKAITGLSGSTNYWVRVKATNAIGAGTWSATKAFTTTTGVPVPVPAGDLDGWTRVGTNPTNIYSLTTEGIRRGTVAGRSALWVESVSTGAASMAGDTYGIQRSVPTVAGKTYRVSAVMTSAFNTAPGTNQGHNYYIKAGTTVGSSATLLATNTFVVMPSVEFIATGSSTTIGLFMDDALTIPGSQNQVEAVAFQSIVVRLLDTDYPQRLRSTVYESNLANHLDLACSSVGASWYVDKQNVTQVNLPGSALPVSFIFSDDPDDDDALSYTDITAGLDTKSVVNQLNVTNYGWNDVDDTELNDELLYVHAESANKYGAYTEDLDLNLWTQPPYDSTLVDRLEELLDTYDHTRPLISSLQFNAQQDIQTAQDLEVGQRITVRFNGTEQDSQVVSISHDIHATRWMVSLDLYPLT